VGWFDHGCGDLAVRSAHFLLLDLAQTFLEAGEEGGGGEEHQQVFVYVFE
jgi:hypothetical protein